MSLELIQKEVTELYYNHFKDYQGGMNLSRPHIPLISEAFLQNRIIILGQETNTWYRQGEDDLLNFYLKNHNSHDPYYGTEPYLEFIRDSVERYPGKFWEFAKKLYDKGLIEGPIQKNGHLGHCWLNLFSVEAVSEKGNTKGRPTNDPLLSKKIIDLQQNLLLNLLKLLKPKLLIALTGRKLNPQLFNQSLGLPWEEIEWITIDETGIFNDQHVSEVKIINSEHPLFGVKIIQAYHPSFFMGRINGTKKIRNKMDGQAINDSISQYYQNILFKWLKENIKN